MSSAKGGLDRKHRHTGLLFQQAPRGCSHSARTLSNRAEIYASDTDSGCVTSVFQPSTNLKHVELHSRGVGSLYSLSSPKRIKNGVIEPQCDLRELYFSNLETADKRKRKRIFFFKTHLKKCPHGQLPLQKESILHKICRALLHMMPAKAVCGRKSRMGILSKDKFLITSWQENMRKSLLLRKASSVRNEIKLQMGTFSGEKLPVRHSTHFFPLFLPLDFPFLRLFAFGGLASFAPFCLTARRSFGFWRTSRTR